MVYVHANRCIGFLMFGFAVLWACSNFCSGDQEADDRTEHIKQLEERCEKLRSVLGRLKEDRTHYHTLADERK